MVTLQQIRKINPAPVKEKGKKEKRQQAQVNKRKHDNDTGQTENTDKRITTLTLTAQTPLAQARVFLLLQPYFCLLSAL